MTTPVEAVTSTRVPSRKRTRMRKPAKRRRGLDTVDDEDVRDPIEGPGNDSVKGDQ